MKKFFKNTYRMLMLMALMSLIVMGIPNVLSAAKEVPRKLEDLQVYPVAASTKIYKGSLVCLDISGNAVAAADTDGYRFIGVSYETVDNSSGSAGDLNIRVYAKGTFKLAATSIGPTLVGRIMCVVDSGTIDESSTNHIPVGILVEYESSTAGWVRLTVNSENIGYQDHVYINTDLAGKAVRLNVKTFQAEASIIGMQTKPRGGVNQTDDVIGMESMPGLGVTTITSTKGIVCYKAEPYIHATAGAITGDVRGYEVSLGCPSGAGTITGVLCGLKAINNTTKAVTGGIFPIYVVAHGDAQPWTGLCLLPDEVGMASVSNGAILADIHGTTNAGYIKVVVGTTVKYIALYDLKAS